MKTLYTLALVFCISILYAQQKGFQAGDIVIFQDSVENEELYEFPSKWKFFAGTVEVDAMDGDQFIDIRSRKGKIEPRFDTDSYLPDWFTIEVDVFCPSYGNTALYLRFNDRDHFIRISHLNVTYDGSGDGRDPVKKYFDAPSKVGSWKKVQVSFHKRALKVYVDDEKMVNIPQIENAPRNVKFDFLSTASAKQPDHTVKINNVRIAEGGIPLYDRLMEEGRLVFQNILFDYNKHSLKSESFPILDDLVKMLKANPDTKIIIEGHTDSDGTAEFNLDLSQKRAQSVKTYMVQNGIPESVMQVKGYGESKPIAMGNSDEDKAKNRRVEFVLDKSH